MLKATDVKGLDISIYVPSVRQCLTNITGKREITQSLLRPQIF